MIKKAIDFLLNLNFKERRRFYNMKFIPLIYAVFLTVILLTYPNYAAHGYDVLNYGVKFLFPIFGAFALYDGIFDNRPYMLNLHSILAVIFDILCVVIIINRPHEK